MNIIRKETCVGIKQHEPRQANVCLWGMRGQQIRSPDRTFLTFILLYCSWCCAVWRPWKVSPYIIIMQVIVYFLWGHWGHSGYFENRIPLKPARMQPRKLQCCICRDSINYYRDFVWSLFPKTILFDFDFTLLSASRIIGYYWMYQRRAKSECDLAHVHAHYNVNSHIFAHSKSLFRLARSTYP